MSEIYRTLPPRQGMYDPDFEHDACGAGFICNLRGEASHEIVAKALRMLNNLTHRGACGCDELTGDGSGVLVQIPHDFYAAIAADDGIPLPGRDGYGTGHVFLPNDAAELEKYMGWLEDVVRAEGQVFLGWRDVPQNSRHTGVVARQGEPVIKQIFIARGNGIKDSAHFERKLFVIRKVIENAVAKEGLPEHSDFYIPSLSARTIVYKGQLLPDQLENYYSDLTDPQFKSGLALVHQRFSTNTFPSWKLAQPFRFLCHNGEINTLRGNINWMNAREKLFKSDIFGDDIAKLLPIVTRGTSDSAILDNALELLYHTGRSLPHAVMMLIPEAWQNHEQMPDYKRAFYEYNSCVMEPWDGPASIPFTDGSCIGAVLDRNGLRPSRYTVTKDGFVVMASETGALEIDPANIQSRGRLQPGRMFLVDMEAGRIVDGAEIKEEICTRKPYRVWLDENLVDLASIPLPSNTAVLEPERLETLQKAFGYTVEDLRILMAPMAEKGAEPIGSMGDDTPLAVLSEKSRTLYDYFRQLFAQVTNPPLDGIREELVTSLVTNIGEEHDLFQETPEHCHQLKLEQPILTNAQLEGIRQMRFGNIRAKTLSTVFSVRNGEEGLRQALDDLFESASRAVDEGFAILILSDRGVDKEHAPIPALLATSGVHHHLIRTGQRTRCGLVVESGEPREVHDYCVLLGYGAGAINPYVALDTISQIADAGEHVSVEPGEAVKNYIKAANKGILKVMSKMGISTLHSYRGAQIFEAIGLSNTLVESCFTGTPSRLDGIGLDIIAKDIADHHDRAYPKLVIPKTLKLSVGGRYQWRRNGEHHLFNPITVANLQRAARSRDAASYDEFARHINDQNKVLGTIRGLLDFKAATESVPLDEVEPWTEIVKRFKTGAMSYGSISKEAHENLAIAMNRLGGRSNTGEGGEDDDRYDSDPNGDLRRSAIKQVASGRFGVTINYLVNSDEIQIKMAQGAKPGEGGQLPGEKVYPWIAKTRHSTPYVGLISPPPHHDIYSIEDLAQLIHDLKNSNPSARISVKLVSEVGVGTVAAGVSKGKADVVLISGHDGGTGASPQTSIKHAGLPWELGLAETQQTLVLNDLRSRIAVEVDGQLKTGRDVAIACLLGGEEFGFATAPLVASGCIMMRKCHLNTCPVGIATQNPELRKKFEGKPEHVVNYFYFVAEELRKIMAELGFRTVDEMIGRSDCLVQSETDHPRARHLNLAPILLRPNVSPSVGIRCTEKQDHGLEQALDNELIEWAQPAIEDGQRIQRTFRIRNVNRTLGTMLSHAITRRWGAAGLPEDTIYIHGRGSAGQSFGAFATRGLTMKIEGDANDYLGKGLSGGKIIVVPPREATFRAEDNIITGNVALYGATSGELYVRGLAGERFCVRNSGAHAVVEGLGDHGCEYMTGGRVVVLGNTGRNFAAGMSGGFAYVLDESGTFADERCNREMVRLETVDSIKDEAELYRLIEAHYEYTDSARAAYVLNNWDEMLPRFIKIVPVEYQKALERLALEEQESKAPHAIAV